MAEDAESLSGSHVSRGVEKSKSTGGDFEGLEEHLQDDAADAESVATGIGVSIYNKKRNTWRLNNSLFDSNSIGVTV
eukprot:CAMPEP_0196811322 /NCGR_PEP_ID=MMETSP1362-20130617/17077_1 /TAXON_ID=163516 /ORGANISM="Leptocylindrus danicus, Strain CCMP1856" /LENGTH=76 /DNA_ID=CAMNT_0042186603 /DNA_START=62 /DNA_END=293 /DNA_ORIENTATION=+